MKCDYRNFTQINKLLLNESKTLVLYICALDGGGESRIYWREC